MHNMWACPRQSVGGNSVYRLCLQVAPKIQQQQNKARDTRLEFCASFVATGNAILGSLLVQ